MKRYTLLLLLAMSFQLSFAQVMEYIPVTQRKPATDFANKGPWMNTSKSLNLAAYKGKPLFIYFWAYGSISCQHLFPDIERFQQDYGTKMNFLSVHRPKFFAEEKAANVKKAIARLGILHPTISDSMHSIWKDFDVKYWPTVVLVDAEGKIVGKHSGEGIYYILKPSIERLLSESNVSPSKGITAVPAAAEGAQLSFPTQLCVDKDGSFYVSEQGTHSIKHFSSAGKLIETIGGGKGMTDGDYRTARFSAPQGLLIKGKTLYVADQGNHAIRRIDLAAKQVSMVLGNGSISENPVMDEIQLGEGLNSPFNLLFIENGDLIYTMAGAKQVWKADLNEGISVRVYGSGQQTLRDGPLKASSFGQPMGICSIGNKLYVADAQVSAIREIDLAGGMVKTLIGKGLYEFGDTDGSLATAKIQFPVGIVAFDGKLYISDSYNGKIKEINLDKNTITTIADGLNEPAGLALSGSKLLVANSNSHEVLQIDLKTKETKVLVK